MVLIFFLREQGVGQAAFNAGDKNDIAAGEIAADRHRAAAHDDLGFAGRQCLNRGDAAFDQNHIDAEPVLLKKSLRLWRASRLVMFAVSALYEVLRRVSRAKAFGVSAWCNANVSRTTATVSRIFIESPVCQSREGGNPRVEPSSVKTLSGHD